MRFKFILEPQESNNTLPLNYQYPVESWIYNTLQKSDADYATWLHTTGYSENEQKHFKLFCFSQLKFEYKNHSISENKIDFGKHPVEIELSFVTHQATESFISGIFLNQEFKLGNLQHAAHFKVQTIQLCPEPEYGQVMKYYAQTPVVISQQRSEKHTTYLDPSDAAYAQLFINNLINKYNSVPQSQSLPMQAINFNLLSDFKKKIITVKEGRSDETKIKGYKFEFELKAPPELHKVLFATGAGEKNSTGFGFVIISKR